MRPEYIQNLILSDRLFIIRKNVAILTRRYNDELRELDIDITVQQLFMLGCLAIRYIPPTITELAEMMGIDRTTVSRGILILAKRGLMTYSSSERDRRANKCMITSEGRKVVEQGIKVLERLRNETN